MVKLTETVLRDGHQSLIATRMKTADMLPIVEKLDRVGFFSLEMWGGATFDVCLRYLKEDPWERLREIRKLVKNTKLQMLLRGQNLVGYRHYPDDIVVKFIQKARDNGIDIFRIFDALNDIRNLALSIQTAKKAGAIVEGTISFTVSPIHTLEKYAKFAFELKDAGADIICIKDMSGIISPTAAYDLVNIIKKEVKLPVHLHAHCSSGMAPICYLTACEAGVDYLDTAISPFAWGTSQPPTESIVGALKGTPFDTGLDLGVLVEISEYFQKVKENYKTFLDPISERVDPKILVHQIPGGMISNLISQLKEQKALDRYNEVLKETALVRKELGYPPLVTPTSQIVGTQAVFNVVTGERYKLISKEVKDYIRGLYGRAPGPVDEEVKKKAIGAEAPINTRPADSIPPEWDKSVDEVKKLGHSEQPSDEDVLSYALFPLVAKGFWQDIADKKEELLNNNLYSSIQPFTQGLDKQAENLPDWSSGQAGGSGKNNLFIELNNQKYAVNVASAGNDKKDVLVVDVNGRTYEVKVSRQNKIELVPPDRPAVPVNEPKSNDTKVKEFAEAKPLVSSPTSQSGLPNGGETKVQEEKSSSTSEFNVTVPMPGKIVDLKVKLGDKVKTGDMLFILEAMKMQNEIDSPCDGLIKEISIKVGDNVDNQTTLIRIGTTGLN